MNTINEETMQAEIDELVKAFEKITEARGYRSVEDEALIAKHRGE